MSACTFSQIDQKPGISIENGPNRGLNYTDSLGVQYSYRNIPITITNDTSIAVQIRIPLFDELNYPYEYGDQQFKVFVLPIELTQEKITFDSLTYELTNRELREFFREGPYDRYIIDESIEPGERIDITIGTLYPRPTNCGVVPKAFLFQSEGASISGCLQLQSHNISSKNHINLALQLIFCQEGCYIVPSGVISFLE